MNTNIKELNIEEMEMANGGINWGRVFGVGWTSAMVGLGAGALAVLAMSNPVGWVATVVVASAAVATGATGTGIATAVEALTD